MAEEQKVPDWIRGEFEKGYRPCDEPPGMEEMWFRLWQQQQGGKVLRAGAWPVFPAGGLQSQGMSVREYIATQALAGLLAAGGAHGRVPVRDIIAEDAVIYADALLAELAKVKEVTNV